MEKFASKAYTVEAAQMTDQTTMAWPTAKAIFDWLDGRRPHEEKIAYCGWAWPETSSGNHFFVYTEKGREWMMKGDWVVVGPEKMVRVVSDRHFKRMFSHSALRRKTDV